MFEEPNVPSTDGRCIRGNCAYPKYLRLRDSKHYQFTVTNMDDI